MRHNVRSSCARSSASPCFSWRCAKHRLPCAALFASAAQRRPPYRSAGMTCLSIAWTPAENLLVPTLEGGTAAVLQPGDKPEGFAPSHCRIVKGLGKFRIKNPKKMGRGGRWRAGAPCHPIIWSSPPSYSWYHRLWHGNTSRSWADLPSLLRCHHHHPLRIFPRSVTSSEVARYPRWKHSMAWCRSTALSISSFLPPLIAPTTVTPLLATDSRRQPPAPRSHFGGNS